MRFCHTTLAALPGWIRRKCSPASKAGVLGGDNSRRAFVAPFTTPEPQLRKTNNLIAHPATIAAGHFEIPADARSSRIDGAPQSVPIQRCTPAVVKPAHCLTAPFIFVDQPVRNARVIKQQHLQSATGCSAIVAVYGLYHLPGRATYPPPETGCRVMPSGGLRPPELCNRGLTPHQSRQVPGGQPAGSRRDQGHRETG